MQLPAIQLDITPQSDENHSVHGLFCSLKLDIPAVSKDDVLVQMVKKSGVVPSQKYDSLQASDDNGALDLMTYDKDNLYLWHPSRTTVGRIVLEFYAKPRYVDSKTQIGSRVDMRSDHGGVGVAGLSFLPLPPAEVDHAIVIRWILDSQEVSVVWSFGEGPGPHQMVGPPSFLQETYFAAGPLRSLVNEGFGFYWFGDLPEKIHESAVWSEKLFRKMGPFFHDSTSTYRVFVRNAVPARGYGGTAFRYSYCLEYDGGLDIIPPDDINQLLAHEMVHNWPLLGKNSDSDETQKIYDWYSEGIADYYSIILPHDIGLVNDEIFIEQINEFLAAYYTHPLIDWTNKRLADEAWSNVYAMTLPYLRGFIYLLKVSGQLGTTKFNEIVNKLLDKKTKGTPATEEDWLHELQKNLGEQSQQEFSDMTQGKTVFPRNSLKAYNLVREDKERFDLGMAGISFTERKVMDLHPDSRAAKSGLQNGDLIIANSPLFLCQEHYLQMQTMKVLRDGTTLEFKYWPRSWDKVEAWQFEKKP